MSAAMPRRPAWRSLALAAGAAGVLATVFTWYLDPHLAVDLATRLWMCF